MNMRIAIIGSQSCGKTTLGRELSKRLDLPMISELARRWDIEKVSQTELIDIQKELLNLQIEEESKYERFISDRSTIDNMAYWLHNVANIVSYDDNRQYKMKALMNICKYSHIFLLVPEFYPKGDGFRSTDIIYQMRIDAIIQTILYLKSVRHYKLTGSIENRVQQAMEILDG